MKDYNFDHFEIVYDCGSDIKRHVIFRFGPDVIEEMQKPLPADCYFKSVFKVYTNGTDFKMIPINLFDDPF